MENIFKQEMAQNSSKDGVVPREGKDISTEYFNTHRDFFETYARGAAEGEPSPIKIYPPFLYH